MLEEAEMFQYKYLKKGQSIAFVIGDIQTKQDNKTKPNRETGKVRSLILTVQP